MALIGEPPGSSETRPEARGGLPAELPPQGIRTMPRAGSATATQVVLIRHGEAQCNVSGVCGGRKGCTGLTKKGIRQVEALVDRLRTTGELAGARALYSSMLPRAVQTAKLVAPTLRAMGSDGTWSQAPPIWTDCSLCELHPGQADGLTWGQFTQRFGDPDWDVEPDRPIAPEGESWSGFVLRVAGALDRVVERHPGGSVVVACHAGVIEASLLTKLPVEGGVRGRRLQLRTLHASLTTWEVDGGRWRLQGYNDAAHLMASGALRNPGADQQA